MDNRKRVMLSRRGILKSFGLAGAAVISSPILHAGESIVTAATKSHGNSDGLNVGILLPDFVDRRFSSNFLNGFYLAIDDIPKADPNGGFLAFVEGSGAGSLQDKFKRLVADGKTDVVVGLVNSRITQSLRHEVAKSGIRFIEANLGENFFHKDTLADTFYQSSLNVWQSHYVLGAWAAKNLGVECICTSSFFDSGYDLLYAFEAGFSSAGGKVTKTIISGSPANEVSAVEAAAIAADSDAPIVFANYSGPDAAVFLSALKNSGGIKSKKILGSTMMIQPRLLSHIGENAIGMISASTWALESSEQSAQFGAKYRVKYGSEADDFAVLGYDTAEILVNLAGTAFQASGGSSVKSRNSRAELQSARGIQKMNSATHSSETPVFIIQMARPDDGHILAKIELPDSITKADFRLIEELESGSIQSYPLGV